MTVPTHHFAFLDHPGPLAFAHRGGAAEGDGPENTMPAFERAVGLGYRYLETDVRATADGVLVVYHDRNLLRLTGRDANVDEVSWRELQSARVADREPIPTLEDLLAAWPHVRLNIDVKHDRAVAPLVEVLQRMGAINRVCIASFNDRRVGRVRRAMGDGNGQRLCTSLGSSAITHLWSGGPARARLPAAGCVQVPVRFRHRVPVVTPRFLARAHRRGLQVHVWTVDEAAEMHRLLDLGVDGLMTDHPAVLKQVLVERGQWSG
jgi:glycerophosphoryl diester phosphodiesterase